MSNNTNLTIIPNMDAFEATVLALKALYPTITKTVAITSGQAIFTDIIMTKDHNGQTLTDIYGKQVATDLVGALVRYIAYGYFLSRPVLIVEGI